MMHSLVAHAISDGTGEVSGGQLYIQIQHRVCVSCDDRRGRTSKQAIFNIPDSLWIGVVHIDIASVQIPSIPFVERTPQLHGAALQIRRPFRPKWVVKGIVYCRRPGIGCNLGKSIAVQVDIIPIAVIDIHGRHGRMWVLVFKGETAIIPAHGSQGGIDANWVVICPAHMVPEAVHGVLIAIFDLYAPLRNQ